MSRDRGSHRPALLPLVATIALLLPPFGCGGKESTGSASDQAAERTEDPSNEFVRWLRIEAGIEPYQADPEARARLYRDYVAERLFAEQAQKQGLNVGSEALATELSVREAAGDDAPDRQRRAEANRKLLALAYEDQVLTPTIEVADSEVEARLSETPRAPGQSVIFRMLRTEERAEAAAARQRIADGQPFESVAVNLSKDPDRGAPQQRALSDLPAAAADALYRLKPGELSPPVQIDEAWYLFQLESKTAPPDPERKLEREVLRAQLKREKYDRARDEALERLAAEAKVSLLEPNTPAAAPPDSESTTENQR